MGDAWRTFVCSLGLALVAPASSGCFSAGVAQAAASSAAAAPLVAALPITLALDAILIGLAGASMAPPAPPSSANYANYGWKDPDDWVAQCEGPLFCAEHRHFVCTGAPGNCECHCEVTPPACVPGLPVETARIACGDSPPPRATTKPVAAR